MKNRLRQIIFGPNHRWWALSIVSLATFMVTTDSGLLSISLPIIIAEFEADLAAGGWLPFIYALVTGALYLPCGRLADLFGRKKILGVGFVLYTASSLLAGFSHTFGQLILFRGLQAGGSALMMATTFALVTELFSPSERGRAMGLSGGMISALGFTVGPALGGFLTYTLGWRAVFFVSFLLGIVGCFGARFILVEDKRTRAGKKREPFDYLGTAAFALSLTTLLLALTEGQKGLWHTPPVRAGLAVAAATLGLFLWWERRTLYPLLDLQLFRIRLFAMGNIARLAAFVTVSMNHLLMPFFLQLVLGLDPLRAGLLMATASVGLGVLSPVSGYLSDRIGGRLLSSAGLALMALAFYSMAALGPGSSSLDVAVRLAVLGIGLGLYQTPNNNLLMSSIPPERLGVASSFLSIVRSLGLSIGVATATALVSARLLALTGQTSLDALRSPAATENAGLPLTAFMQGYRYTCITAVVLCLIGALASSVPAPRNYGGR
jgi:EmrB/QacA subfamily drug resistance transporter